MQVPLAPANVEPPVIPGDGGSHLRNGWAHVGRGSVARECVHLAEERDNFGFMHS